MAAGAITLDAGKNPVAVGPLMLVTGNIQVDNTYRGFAILPTTSYIISFVANDTSGAGSIECDYNVNSAGTATQGSVGVAGNHTTTNTYNFICYFHGM